MGALFSYFQSRLIAIKNTIKNSPLWQAILRFGIREGGPVAFATCSEYSINAIANPTLMDAKTLPESGSISNMQLLVNYIPGNYVAMIPPLRGRIKSDLEAGRTPEFTHVELIRAGSILSGFFGIGAFTLAWFSKPFYKLIGFPDALAERTQDFFQIAAPAALMIGFINEFLKNLLISEKKSSYLYLIGGSNILAWGLITRPWAIGDWGFPPQGLEGIAKGYSLQVAIQTLLYLIIAVLTPKIRDLIFGKVSFAGLKNAIMTLLRHGTMNSLYTLVQIIQGIILSGRVARLNPEELPLFAMMGAMLSALNNNLMLYFTIPLSKFISETRKEQHNTYLHAALIVSNVISVTIGIIVYCLRNLFLSIFVRTSNALLEDTARILFQILPFYMLTNTNRIVLLGALRGRLEVGSATFLNAIGTITSIALAWFFATALKNFGLGGVIGINLGAMSGSFLTLILSTVAWNYPAVLTTCLETVTSTLNTLTAPVISVASSVWNTAKTGISSALRWCNFWQSEEQTELPTDVPLDIATNSTGTVIKIPATPKTDVALPC